MTEATEIIGVRFKRVGKIYYFDPNGQKIDVGQHVIVETPKGIEFGKVEIPNRTLNLDNSLLPLKKVIRIATESDCAKEAHNREREKEALTICSEKIKKHKLDMKLVDVELTFDLSKILFYFTSEGRVDFRDLVKDLAAVFRMRIELRQIGVRDEAKILNGIGICGRPLCCATFLGDFQPVSIKMAKDQNMSLNPTKISGICGRLMCCLKYEESTYDYLTKNLPSVDDFVMTEDGIGQVISINVLRQTMKIAVKKKPEDEPIVNYYHASKVKAVPRKNLNEKNLNEKNLNEKNLNEQKSEQLKQEQLEEELKELE